MRGVEFHQASEEQLTIRRRRSFRAAAGPGLALSAWAGLVAVLGPASLYGMIVLGVGAGFLPWLVPKLGAALRTFTVSLSRGEAGVLLDEEPLEAARVETRLVSTFLTRDPKGYSLSLWVLLTEGRSRDLELGRFRTLLEAAQASGRIEAFLARASLKSKPASTVR